MLMLRKTFSRSFASSAASGDDSSTTWSLMLRSSAAARFVACGRGRPDEARDALAGAGGIAGVDPLGGEREVEIDAGLQPAPLDDLAERTGRRPGERRGLEHDQLARADVAADRLGGRQDRGQVGVLRRGDRGRDAHEDRVRLGDRRHRPATTTRSPRSSAAPSRSSETSSIGEVPAWSSAIRPGDASTPSTLESGLRRTRWPAAGRRSRGRSRPRDGLESRILQERVVVRGAGRGTSGTLA